MTEAISTAQEKRLRELHEIARLLYGRYNPYGVPREYEDAEREFQNFVTELAEYQP